MSPKPADVRAALQRVAAAVQALLGGTADPLVHEVTTRDLHRLRRALTDAGLFKRSTIGVGGKGGSHPGSHGSTAIGVRDSAPSTSSLETPTERSSVSTPRTTWLTPYIDVYTASYGEQPTTVAIRRMARTFKQLEVEKPRAECLRRFRNYLRATPARFYSVEHFARSWPAWSSPVGDYDRRDARPNESADDYIARVSK